MHTGQGGFVTSNMHFQAPVMYQVTLLIGTQHQALFAIQQVSHSVQVVATCLASIGSRLPCLPSWPN